MKEAALKVALNYIKAGFPRNPKKGDSYSTWGGDETWYFMFDGREWKRSSKEEIKENENKRKSLDRTAPRS